jgi:chromosomal replication initiation ATPase DnaA
VSADTFIDRCATHLDIEVAELASRSRQQRVVEARRLVITLGRERWGQSAKELASALGKSADTVSYLSREGIRQRMEDEGFSQRYEALDAEMVGGSR